MQEIKSGNARPLERLVGRAGPSRSPWRGWTRPATCAEDRALLEQALDGDVSRARRHPGAAGQPAVDRRHPPAFRVPYIWEVYKPVAEREYGLRAADPVWRPLCGVSSPARKRSGAAGRQELWWEEEVKPSAEMQAGLQRCFRRFLSFLDAGIADRRS